jgi:hypothetical protein
LDANGGTLTFIENDITGENAQLNNLNELISSFKIQLEGEDRSDFVQFSFSENASMGIDRGDAYQLTPLTDRFAHIFTRIENVPVMLNNLPNEFTQYELPVGIYSSISGEMTLSWSEMYNLPDEWSLYLVDSVTGTRVNLTEQESYTFVNEAQADANKLNNGLVSKSGSPVLETSAKTADRFVVEINATATSVPGSELPSLFALNQNYPNPFNPTTQISYDLPENAEVRLDVFNIQGQRVATLVNTSMNAGSHNVNFDASNLASGVYIYRLQAGSQVLTKKMTLVK